MDILRTPDERFAGLPGYAFAPHYVHSGDLRIHYVEEGPRAAAPVLLLHGEPSWSYLYRRMIPIIAGAGHRVLAPDLVGFGRSDKPTSREDYTYARHVQWMCDLVEALDLRAITLVCQDWGGLIGLRLAAEHEERFSRIVAANTGLPTGDVPPGRAFLAWQRFSQRAPEFRASAIVRVGCATPLTDEVAAAYDAPFPDDRSLAGARQFPLLVPTRPDDPAAPANRRAWEALRRWEKPFLCAYSDGDPITRGADKYFAANVPGAQGQPHTTISGAGHFLQEDQGEALAAVIVDFLARG
ncbi:MAG: haloalkane dehalogenase [Ktedonobacterales bacterium]|nr:haloalkane dehalogenase [Ktedonobacterales bacterium]